MTAPHRVSPWSGSPDHARPHPGESETADTRTTSGTISRIVVPLDGSTTAEAALPHALGLARTFDAKLLLLSVTQPPPLDATSVDSAEWRLARTGTWIYLERVAGKCSSLGIDADWTVAEGPPPDEILRFTDENHADLIILCSHGTGGITEYNLSGTVSKVVHSAGCSVLVTRARTQQTGTELVSYDRVLAPVDCTKRSDWAARVASSIARSHDAELLLVSVIARPRILGDATAVARASALVDEVMRLNTDVARRHLRRLAESVVADGLRVRQLVVEGTHVGRALQRVAETENCSLIVLSAHGGTPAPDWPFGSVPGLLIEHSTKPVLVLQDLAWKERTAEHDAHDASSGLPPRWT